MILLNPHAKVFIHAPIHSLFNSYINIYRLVNYVLSFVRCSQHTVIRHINKQTNKQNSIYLLWWNLKSTRREFPKSIQSVFYKTNVPAILFLSTYPGEGKLMFTQKSFSEVLFLIANNRNPFRYSATDDQLEKQWSTPWNTTQQWKWTKDWYTRWQLGWIFKELHWVKEKINSKRLVISIWLHLWND